MGPFQIVRRRFSTWSRFAFSPAQRAEWRDKFHSDPCLQLARCMIEQAKEEGEDRLGYQTLAGFFNDSVNGGWMTEAQARRIFNERSK